ncbi:hypothetical protein BDV96DRAFT_327080 [Lophiotrema nucula]|uniref:Uncharacterized protein n=1 Tax=Lophiotrema nucula TaxID=690887 RepID=A0A6A5YHT6_9PLEO|nr:hypothetical protein BDV96DRAFT_327080 [Lophiotrema nucula]
MSPFAAQALRRITSEGSSSSGSLYSRADNMIHSIHGTPLEDKLNEFSAGYYGMTSWGPARQASFASAFCSSQPGISISPPDEAIDPVLNMIGMHPAQTQTKAASALPALSLRTDLKRSSPGYPVYSPTEDAKFWFPSPVSMAGSGAPTPRANTLMSIDGSSMCGPSRRCNSHNYEHYGRDADSHCLSDAGSSDRSVDGLPWVSPGRGHSPSHAQRGASPARSTSTTSLSPASPISPRAAMMKNMFKKQAFQDSSPFHKPGESPPGVQRFDGRADSNIPVNSMSYTYYDGATTFACPNDGTHWAPASPTDSSQSTAPPLSLCIATGTEYYTPSPIWPYGHMMWYFSNRPTDSGFLAVPPLTEAQVAEYRFWRPCGKRSCAFGCGGANEGEMAAAKRLFRDEVVVQEEPELGEEHEEEEKKVEKPRMSREDYIKMFRNRSRDGVADI